MCYNITVITYIGLKLREGGQNPSQQSLPCAALCRESDRSSDLAGDNAFGQGRARFTVHHYWGTLALVRFRIFPVIFLPPTKTLGEIL